MNRFFYFLFALILFSAASLLYASNTYLGVYLENLTEQEKRDLDIGSGVRVSMVIKNSPAEENGIQPNDIILRINDSVIHSQEQVSRIIRSYEPGEVITLDIFSDKNRKRLKVALGDLNQLSDSSLIIQETKAKYIGVKLQNLTDQLKEFFQAKQGVLIAEVEPESPAERADLRAGDIVTTVDESSVDSVKDFLEIIQQKQIGEEVLIEYLRQGNHYRVSVEVLETDELYSIDLNNEVIFLREKDLDMSEVGRWFQSVFSDSTRRDLEKKIYDLQEELIRLRRKLLNQE